MTNCSLSNFKLDPVCGLKMSLDFTVEFCTAFCVRSHFATLFSRFLL